MSELTPEPDSTGGENQKKIIIINPIIYDHFVNKNVPT
jgi:hypothetical protein